MLGERRGAKAHALVPHDARLDDDAAAIRPKARHRHRAPSASEALRAATATLAQRREPLPRGGAANLRREPLPLAARPPARVAPSSRPNPKIAVAGGHWASARRQVFAPYGFSEEMYGRGAPEPYGIIASNQPPTRRKLARLLSRPPRFSLQQPQNTPNRQTITAPGRVATRVIRLVQTAERTTDSVEQPDGRPQTAEQLLRAVSMPTRRAFRLCHWRAGGRRTAMRRASRAQRV